MTPRQRWYAKLKADPERWAEYKRKNNERSRKWRAENLEKESERHRNWYKENLERSREQSRRYREVNRERLINYGCEYYQANKEALLEKYRQIRKDNTEPKRAYDRQRSKNQNRIEARREYIERGRAIIAEAKAGKSCECGESNPKILEFHHLDRSEKVANVGHKVKGWSKDRIFAEIDKCILLCVNCHRIKEREMYPSISTTRSASHIRNNRARINAIKAEAGCYRCGIHDFRCLEFHHLDPTTKAFNISTELGKSISIKRLLAEISKCIVLCANCHKLEHIGIRNAIEDTERKIEEIKG